MPIIQVENLSKAYRLGTIGGRTLEADFARWWARIRGKPDPYLKIGEQMKARTYGESFWALRNVGFEVREGEVLGIIGRNGAGKSTLLKILSQVTGPTHGEVRIKGRIASLLEVGTGFHPDLTGRENVFMNGAILGMTKDEIRQKFDEIVAFAEVEEFIDTPVKRYSSGMYVRLAFAVAAHLEPEILVVDEVLAVGDQQFQNKCVKKLESIAHVGRTVLLVSHNLSTVRSVCTRAIQLHDGHVVGDGPPGEQVRMYVERLAAPSVRDLESRTDRDGNGRIRISAVSCCDEFGNATQAFFQGGSVSIRIMYFSFVLGRRPVAAVSAWSMQGEKIFHVDSQMRGAVLPPLREGGTYTCQIPRINLAPGRYYLNVLLAVDGDVADHVQRVAEFDVVEGDYFGIGQPARAAGGMMLVDHTWQ